MSDPVSIQDKYDALTKHINKSHRESCQAQKQQDELIRGKIRIFSEDGRCHPICTFYRGGIEGRCSMWVAINPTDESGYKECRPTDKCPGNGFYRLVPEDD